VLSYWYDVYAYSNRAAIVTYVDSLKHQRNELHDRCIEIMLVIAFVH